MIFLIGTFFLFVCACGREFQALQQEVAISLPFFQCRYGLNQNSSTSSLPTSHNISHIILLLETSFSVMVHQQDSSTFHMSMLPILSRINTRELTISLPFSLPNRLPLSKTLLLSLTWVQRAGQKLLCISRLPSSRKHANHPSCLPLSVYKQIFWVLIWNGKGIWDLRSNPLLSSMGKKRSNMLLLTLWCKAVNFFFMPAQTLPIIAM